MTRFAPLMATAALLLGTTALQASEIKIGFNNVDDAEINGEAAFAHGFRDALKGTDFTVSLFPSDTLGKEKERLDQVSTGLLEIDLGAISTAYSLSPLLKGATLPFFFSDDAEMDKITSEPAMMEAFNAPMLETGVRFEGLNIIGTPMGIHNSKHPVSTVEDLSDLRFRALNGEQLSLMEALGTHGTVIAWAEVANAIQTGVTDGYFNPPSSSLRTGHTSFLKYYTPADLFPSTRAVMISDDWYQGLSDEEKTQIDAALAAGFKANREWIADWSSKVDGKLEEAGVTITPLATGERDKMEALAKPLWATTLTADELKTWQDAKAAADSK
ncbi:MULTISPECIES: TRAP transporter substrate-binding protein [Thioclava]|uniref:TRAP transporter substrate-binding protein n=1 Tax=Thioclava kandeliae TaxID=3070818 RepID=A0ABV1SJW0_9RHOB